MRIRYPFAGAFGACLLLFGYVSLSSFQIPQISSTVLKFLAFFVLTLLFYWIFDSTRRRILNFTLLFVTLFLGLGEEAVQGVVAVREFDPLNIGASIIGSLAALSLCSLYHKRMLDRRRQAKGYGMVPQEGEDLEMGGQETGVVEDDEREPSHAAESGQGTEESSKDGK